MFYIFKHIPYFYGQIFNLPKVYMKERYIENDYAEIWYEDGIIYEIFKPNTVLSLAAANKVLDDRLNVSNKQICPIFVDIKHLIHADNKAKKLFSSVEGLQYLNAGAFVIDNYLSRLAFNIFMRIFKPVIPTRSFPDRESAVKWLQHYKFPN